MTTIDNRERTLELLNKALEVEYSMVIHCTRLSSIPKDEVTRNLIIKLGEDSIRHANVVASAITELGGNPRWSFESFPEDMALVDVFQLQLEREKLALQLHSQNANSQIESSNVSKFEDIAREEENHIEIVKTIISRLTEHH